MNLSKKLWHGNDIWLFSLTHNDITLEVSNLGCTIISLTIVKDTVRRNIVLGYPTAAEYLSDSYYVGSLIGRYAGRIGGAAFDIDERRYRLSANENNTYNHLHGGVHGFNKKVFTVVSESTDGDQASVKFYYRSPHMEEGYPGNLDLYVTISLDTHHRVTIMYEAQTDVPTCINLTHHCYFNLTGGRDALQQQLQLHSDRFLVTGRQFIPTGEIRGVAHTPYDFNHPVTLRSCTMTSGYNDYFIFGKDRSDIQARLSYAEVGIAVSIETTFPGVLLYTGDYLSIPFAKNEGICLEAQGYPDAPNHPEFPPAVLRPGEKYCHQTKFIVENIR